MALQYNMHVTEDPVSSLKKNRKMILITILIAVAGIGILMTVSYFLNNRCYSSYRVDSEVGRSDSNNVSYTYYNGNILKYSRSGISTIDNTGKSLQNGGFDMKHPQIYFGGIYFGADYITGRLLYVNNGKDEGTCIETTLPIVRAKISKKGMTAVLLQDSDSNVLNVYDPYNSTNSLLVEIPTNVNEEGYPLDFDISADGASVIVAYMVREGKTIENKVNFYNFTEVGQDRNTLVGGKTFDDSMIGKIEFMGNNEAAVFHEKGVTLFSNMKQPSVTAELTFPDQIQSMAYNEKYLAVVTGDAEAEQKKLHLYDLKGREKLTRAISYKYDDMQLYDDEIIFLSSRSCHILRINGHEKFVYEFDQEVDALFPTANRSVYTLIDQDKIQKIKLTWK